jgi:hypothetical protein
MDQWDAYTLIRGVGCQKIAEDKLDYPLRHAIIYSCQKDSAFPLNMDVVFLLELTKKENTSVSLYWETSGLAAPPTDRDVAERAARRLLEAVGILDVDLIVKEFLRDVPMTGEVYYLNVENATRKVSVSRRACDDYKTVSECHSIGVSD